MSNEQPPQGPTAPPSGQLPFLPEPTSIDELFSRDPLSLTDVDLATIIQVLRKQRENWAIEEAQGKKRASSPKAADAGGKPARAKPAAKPGQTAAKSPLPRRSEPRRFGPLIPCPSPFSPSSLS